MLATIFTVFLIGCIFRVLAIGIRITWRIAKLFLLLFIVIGLVYAGLIYFAVPILTIIGIVFLIRRCANT